MANEIAVAHTFSAEDVALIKETVCKGATDTEFKLFMNQCRTTGLNPLARQVFAVKRWDQAAGRDVMSIQVSIDGFRLIAERTGKYAGQTAPEWCGEDGVWKDVWLSSKPPSAARVGILRSDFKEPCWGVARFDAYAQRKKDQSLTMMWIKMGDVMIAKCAESLALRKTFPQELSGLYTSDEMAQTQTEESEQPKHPTQQLQPPSLLGRAEAFLTNIKGLKTVAALNNNIAASNSLLFELKNKHPEEFDKISAGITALQQQLNQQESK